MAFLLADSARGSRRQHGRGAGDSALPLGDEPGHSRYLECVDRCSRTVRNKSSQDNILQRFAIHSGDHIRGQ